MSTIINNNNSSQKNEIKINKINKFEDTKIDDYVLRKQINSSISNCFISRDIFNNNHFLPTLNNIKSKNEELQKINEEILSIEDKINELEIIKKLKLIKVI